MTTEVKNKMGNTTFSGPIRSQNGTRLISKNSSTGLISDRTLADSGVRDARRFFLEEWFLTVEVQRALNRNWEALGTNMTTALATFNTTSAGILLTTATADQDQAIITPHLDTAATAWAGCLWGTENQVHFETSINTTAIDNQKVWAGLKLTNDHLVATDDDQAYFKFQTDATNSEAFTDFTKLHFVHSVGGTDFISQLPITVAANTIYNLKITIDSNRKASIFVDGVQYNVTGTSGSTGGTAVTTGTTPSGALDDDIDLIPYVGLENGAAAAEAIGVHYVCMSRIINE